jgi:hypothetical protein
MKPKYNIALFLPGTRYPFNSLYLGLPNARFPRNLSTKTLLRQLLLRAQPTQARAHAHSHTQTHVYPPTHPPIHSTIYPFIHSLVHPFVHASLNGAVVQHFRSSSFHFYIEGPSPPETKNNRDATGCCGISQANSQYWI